MIKRELCKVESGENAYGKDKEMFFYLKVNRMDEFVFKNVQHWIDCIALLPDSVIYIICDKPELRQSITNRVDSKNKEIEFLSSCYDAEVLQYIISNITDAVWRKAGYAHATTFWHAKQNNIEKFWNIDADDTYVCLDPVRMVEMLKIVEKYADENGINIFSLDMWRSNLKTYKGLNNWSFGITYTDNSVDWLELMTEHCEDKEFRCRDLELLIDDFFTYLKRCTEYRFETFCFDNLKFIHYSEDFFGKTARSGFYHWKGDKLLYPILRHCIGMRENSEVPIADDVIKFNMNIKEEEGMMSLLAGTSSKDRGRFMKEQINSGEKAMSELMKKRNDLYVSMKLGKEYSLNSSMESKNIEIVGWGSGMCFYKNYSLIKDFYDLKYVCDNDSAKWGKTLIDNVKCISPETLKNMEDVIVIIMVEDTVTAFEMVQDVVKLGITKFDYIYTWLDYVQGSRRI